MPNKTRKPTLNESYEIPATSSKGQMVRNLVKKFCRTAGLPQSQIDGIQLAVSEAFNNAVEHGLEFNGEKHITLNFKIHPQKLVIEVEDRGKGIDFKTLNHTSALLNWSERGHGLQIINALLDGVQVECLSPRGTRLSLMKWID